MITNIGFFEKYNGISVFQKLVTMITNFMILNSIC